MKPVKFLGHNAVYGQNQEGVLPLPAYRDEHGQVVTCWELDEEELQQVSETGKVWLMQTTGNFPLQPVCMSASPIVTFPEQDN